MAHRFQNIPLVLLRWARDAKERGNAVQYLSAKLGPQASTLPTHMRARIRYLRLFAYFSGLFWGDLARECGGSMDRLVRVYRADKFIASGATTACEAEEATIPAEEHTFTHDEFPGYTDPYTSVLWMVDNPLTLAQRRQLSGLCYMHAPTVVQYYLIWLAALKAGLAVPGHGMLDLTYDIASNFSPLRLAHHVLDDVGGSSVNYLKGILQPNSELATLWAKGDHRAYLRQFGPGLVAGFHVYADFLEKDVHKHYQPQAGSKLIGLHAMVIVGMRVDSSGQLFYLLQNWWAGKQFVEVSQEYLAFCDPQIHYVVTPQTGVPRGRHTHSAAMHFAETEAVLEKEERLPLEMAAALRSSQQQLA